MAKHCQRQLQSVHVQHTHTGQHIALQAAGPTGSTTAPQDGPGKAPRQTWLTAKVIAKVQKQEHIIVKR